MSRGVFFCAWKVQENTFKHHLRSCLKCSFSPRVQRLLAKYPHLSDDEWLCDSAESSLFGEQSELESRDLVPNSEMIWLSADSSPGFDHVRVSHWWPYVQSTPPQRSGAFLNGKARGCVAWPISDCYCCGALAGVQFIYDVFLACRNIIGHFPVCNMREMFSPYP